jgi:hypothetical protein
VTEEQRDTIVKLLVSMPGLGGHFVPVSETDPVPNIIENLENLKESLDYWVESTREKEQQLQDYRELKRSLSTVGRVFLSDFVGEGSVSLPDDLLAQ